MLGIEELPEDPRALAEALFCAKEVRVSQVLEAKATWRRFHRSKEAPAETPATPRWMQQTAAAKHEESAVELRDVPERGAMEERKTDEGAAVSEGVAVAAVEGKQKRQGLPVGLLLGLGVILAVGGAVAAVALNEPKLAAPSARGEGTSAPVMEVAPVPVGNSVQAPSVAPDVAANPAAPPSSSIVPAMNEATEGMRGAAPVRGSRSWKPTTSGKPTKKDRSSVIVVPD